MNEHSNYKFDDRAETFLQVGDVAAHVARVHSGVDVDAETHERWRQLMALLREVDTLADDEQVPSEDLLAELKDFSLFEERYPRLSFAADTSNQHEKLLVRTEKLLKLGRFVAQEASVKRFTALRIAEGRETANLLADSASEYVLGQREFQEGFMPVIRSLGIFATLIDSVLDAHVDKKAGKISIDINHEYYQMLIGETFRRSKLGAAALLHGTVMREFGVMSINRLKNRIQHGAQNYSSLSLFRRK